LVLISRYLVNYSNSSANRNHTRKASAPLAPLFALLANVATTARHVASFAPGRGVRSPLPFHRRGGAISTITIEWSDTPASRSRCEYRHEMTRGANEGVAKAWSSRKPLPRAPPFSFEYQVYSVIPGLWCRHISVQPSVANLPKCSAHTNVLPVSSKGRPERTARTDAAALSVNPGKGCAITLRFRPNRSFSMPPRCRVTFFDNRHQIYRSLLIDSALPLVAAERALAWLAERHVLPEDLGHRSRSSTSARRNKAFYGRHPPSKLGAENAGRVMPNRVCTVQGQDHRGHPLSVHGETGSMLEAAASGMDQISRSGGRPSELEITMHVPRRTWKIDPDRLIKWVSRRDSKRNIRLQAVKRQVQDFLSKLEA
jgi:hypothetical protein